MSRWKSKPGAQRLAHRFQATAVASCESTRTPSQSSRRRSTASLVTSQIRALPPQVDAGFRSISVDFGEFLGGEVQIVERAEVLLQLRDAGRTDQSGCDRRVAEHPRQRELRQRLTAPLGDPGESPQSLVDLAGYQVVVECRALGGAGDVGRGLVEITIRQQALRERSEGDRTHARVLQLGHEVTLDPPVE